MWRLNKYYNLSEPINLDCFLNSLPYSNILRFKFNYYQWQQIFEYKFTYTGEMLWKYFFSNISYFFTYFKRISRGRYSLFTGHTILRLAVKFLTHNGRWKNIYNSPCNVFYFICKHKLSFHPITTKICIHWSGHSFLTPNPFNCSQSQLLKNYKGRYKNGQTWKRRIGQNTELWNWNRFICTFYYGVDYKRQK